MIQKLLILIQDNPMVIAALILAIFELFLRLKPTKRNLSILDFLHKIVNLIFPNFSSIPKQQRLREAREAIKQQVSQDIASKDKFKIQ